jgi:rare lipoprotein A
MPGCDNAGDGQPDATGQEDGMVRVGSPIPQVFARVTLVVATLSLAACEFSMPGGSPTVQPGDEVTATRAGGRRVVERDVEAPQVFQRDEPGLWDGRPSLGGVWVAHPDVRDPERVVIRNPQTGARVVGALFRRERENPGPRFQISSEAASALGILPGAPTQISVTALRLQQVETAPSATETPQDPDRMAAAPAPAAAPASQPLTPPQPTGPADTVAILTEPAPTPARRGLFGRAARPVSEQIATTALDAPGDAFAAASVQPATGVPQAAPRTEAPRQGLFGRRAPAPAPAPAPDVTLIPLPEDTAPVSQPVAPAASTLDRPFAQIGIFSVEANARNAQAQMQRAGLAAEIRPGQSQGQPFWRVVVGPARDAAERQRILTQVRGLGFQDAYFVVR